MREHPNELAKSDRPKAIIVYVLLRVPFVREWRAPSRRVIAPAASPTVAVGQPTFR